MSKLIATLLNEPPADIASLVFNLEKLSGHSGIDVRLSLEIERLANDQIKKLGLDPADSTGEEIYHALLSRFGADNHRFTRSIGGRSHHEHRELVPLVVEAIDKLKLPNQCWAPRHSAIKEILKQVPPKKMIKLLGYRSADSFIKREEVEEILAAAPFVESAVWAKAYNQALVKLTSSDFEKRPLRVICLPKERWAKLPRQGAVVGYVSSSASVVVWPIDPARPNALALAVLIIQAANSLRVVSSWLEFNQVKVSPGKMLVSTFDDRKLSSGIRLSASELSWREIIHLYSHGASELPPALSAHLAKSDVDFPAPTVALVKIDHSLSWWLGLGYTGASYNPAISFNLTDTALNYANQLPYHQSCAAWLGLNLREELYSRYLANQWVEDSLLAQLEEV